MTVHKGLVESFFSWYCSITHNIDLATLQTNWQTATLQNSWVNVSAGAYGEAVYMKDILGFVHLRGYISSGSTTLGATILTLPAGYRPDIAQNLPVMAGGVTSSNYGALQIGTNGTVEYLVGGNIGISLSGITFKAA